ncbi:MAG: hypothetical protein ACOY71_13650 [Gemmatimonadota bacterium]
MPATREAAAWILLAAALVLLVFGTWAPDPSRRHPFLATLGVACTVLAALAAATGDRIQLELDRRSNRYCVRRGGWRPALVREGTLEDVRGVVVREPPSAPDDHRYRVELVLRGGDRVPLSHGYRLRRGRAETIAKRIDRWLAAARLDARRDEAGSSSRPPPARS